jgi:hypothetical protein
MTVGIINGKVYDSTGELAAGAGQTEITLALWNEDTSESNSVTSYSDAGTDICQRFIFDKPNWDAIFGAGNWEIAVIGAFSVNQTTDPISSVYAEIYDVTNDAQINEQQISTVVSAADAQALIDVTFAGTVPAAKATGKFRTKKDGTTSVYYTGAYRLVVRAV